jgi:hypothetical protein
LRAQRRNFAGFPFDRPHRPSRIAGGTLDWPIHPLRFGVCQSPAEGVIPLFMTDNRTRFLAILLGIVAAAMLRLVPHPPNFSPIGAMALFSGAYLGRRWIALAAPLGALLLSDLILGFYNGMIVQYVATALAVAIGWAVIGQDRGIVRVAGGALGSALAFFLLTNFGVWASSGMYPHSLAGLGACYVAALPFFQSSLAGDVSWTALLFGGFALAERGLPALRDRAPARA